MSETNSHKFYQVPKELVENPCYRHALSSDAKLIYGLLLDRMSLSKKNGWANENGEIFLLYTKDHIADILGITPKTVYAAFKTLEFCGLIKQERQGLNKPNKIYIGKVGYAFSIASIPQLARICKICRSGCVNFTGQDITNLQSNYTDLNETNINKTDNIRFLKTNDNFLSFYLNQYQIKFNKNHPRITPEQEDYINSSIETLKEYGIEYDQWEESVTDYFDNLPKRNNGNILAFLKASKRFFDVDLETAI